MIVKALAKTQYKLIELLLMYLMTICKDSQIVGNYGKKYRYYGKDTKIIVKDLLYEATIGPDPVNF